MAAVGPTYLFLGLFVFDLVLSLAHIGTYACLIQPSMLPDMDGRKCERLLLYVPDS